MVLVFNFYAIKQDMRLSDMQLSGIDCTTLHVGVRIYYQIVVTRSTRFFRFTLGVPTFEWL